MNQNRCESWKDVAGYEGLYQVSSNGKIKSIARSGTSKRDKILKHSLTKGYPSVNLSKEDVVKKRTIHRIVAIAFLSESAFEGSQVNHKNGVKTDNRVSNLEWVTASENARHAHDNGLIKNYSTFWLGTKGGTTSKPITQLSLDGKMLNQFRSATIASETTGICRQHISQCCTGLRKTAGGYLWKHSDIPRI